MTGIVQLLGKDVDNLLQYRCITTPSDQPYLLGHGYVDRVMIDNNRPPAVLCNIRTLYNTECLAGIGYLSTLPVSRGVEYSAEASFAINPLYLGPKNVVGLAIETGCNCVASTYGVLVSVSRCYAHRIPFLVKLSHNETLGYPNIYDQTLHTSVEQAFDMGAVTVGVTIYFGSEESCRQIEGISAAFKRVHELGTVIVLWTHLRSSAFKKDGADYHILTDLTDQASHLAATIGADIVKQKMAENNGDYKAIDHGYTGGRAYSKPINENLIDLMRYQLVSHYMGWIGLINSGSATSGETDLSDAMRTATINKRAGGMELILGCRVFKESMVNGVKPINAVQDVYLNNKVTIV